MLGIFSLKYASRTRDQVFSRGAFTNTNLTDTMTTQTQNNYLRTVQRIVLGRNGSYDTLHNSGRQYDHLIHYITRAVNYYYYYTVLNKNISTYPSHNIIDSGTVE